MQSIDSKSKFYAKVAFKRQQIGKMFVIHTQPKR